MPEPTGPTGQYDEYRQFGEEMEDLATERLREEEEEEEDTDEGYYKEDKKGDGNPVSEEQAEGFVQDKAKAYQMARAELPVRTLATRAKELGNLNLQNVLEVQAKNTGIVAGNEYDKTKSEYEKILHQLVNDIETKLSLIRHHGGGGAKLDHFGPLLNYGNLSEAENMAYSDVLDLLFDPAEKQKVIKKLGKLRKAKESSMFMSNKLFSVPTVIGCELSVILTTDQQEHKSINVELISIEK